MRRSALLSLLCVALGPVTWAAIPTKHYTITTGKGEYLLVEGGNVVIGKKSGSDEERVAPDRWVVEDGQLRSSTSGLYLTFDPTDKQGKVFLAKKPMKDARWDSTRQRGRQKNTEREFAGAEWGYVEASSGLLKGGRLDAEVTEGKGGEKTVRLLIRKEPKRIVEIAKLYTHK